MWVVLVGVILLYSNPSIGIFVIVLGVQVWTSGKARERKRQTRVAELWIEPMPYRGGPGFAAMRPRPAVVMAHGNRV